MIHAQTSRAIINHQSLKKYIVAVIGGALLGGAYVLLVGAVPGRVSLTPSPKISPIVPRPVVEHPSHRAKLLRVRHECDSGTANVVVLPMSATGQGAESRLPVIGDAACSWAI